MVMMQSTILFAIVCVAVLCSGKLAAAKTEKTTWYRAICATDDNTLYKGVNVDGSVFLLENEERDEDGKSRKRGKRGKRGRQSASSSDDNDGDVPTRTRRTQSLRGGEGRILDDAFQLNGPAFSFPNRSLQRRPGIGDRRGDNGNEIDYEDEDEFPPIYFRRCACADPRGEFNADSTYCPVDVYDDADILCGVPTDSSRPVDCYDYSIQRIVVRNSWPLVVVWTAALLLICACSMHGRGALGYMHSLCPYLCGQSRRRQQDLLEQTLDRLQAQADQRRTQGAFPDMPGRHRLLTWQRAQLDRIVIICSRHSRQAPIVMTEDGRPPSRILSALLGPREAVASSDTGTNNNTNGGSSSSTRPRPRLVLKTKAYQPKSSMEAPRTAGSVSTLEALSPKNDAAPLPVVDTSLRDMVPQSASSANLAEQRPQSAHVDSLQVDHVSERTSTTKSTSPAGSQMPTTNIEIDVIQNNNDDDDDDDEDCDESPSCAICFVPLEGGDRVGDLTCGHNFHVDCLKTWLPRRNTCPLCQAPRVAQFHRSLPSTMQQEQEPSNGGGS